jgi:hypothetical protein
MDLGARLSKRESRLGTPSNQTAMIFPNTVEGD